MKIYNIVLGAAFMMAMALASSCQKADISDVLPEEAETKENGDPTFYVYDCTSDGYIKYDAMYDDARTVIYFDGKNAGKIKKAFYNAGIRMSVIMGNGIQLSSDFKNFDEVIDFDELVYASVGTSVENAYTFPGVEYAAPFLRVSYKRSIVPLKRNVDVYITSTEKLEELTKMVDEYGLEFYSVPESGTGKYTVICNRNSKMTAALFASALIESRFSGVYYDLFRIRLAAAVAPNIDNEWDRPYGIGGYGGYFWNYTSPLSFFLDGDDEVLKELYGDLDGIYDYYNIR